MTSPLLKNKSLKLTSWLLAAVFIFPWIAAHSLYALREKLSFKTLENGKFLTPPIAAQPLAFFNSAWLGKWQIVYLQSQECDAQCHAIMPALKQIHQALGKDNHRVEYRALSPLATTVLNPGELGVIDPRGWLIMRYPANINPTSLLKDMRRLLKYSHVG